MGWIDIGDALWKVRPWMVVLFPAIYLIPIARVLGFPLQYGGRHFVKVNRLFGKWEHLVMKPRDTIVTAYLLGGIIWHAFVPARDMSEWMHAIAALVGASLIAVGFLQASFRRKAHLELAQFAGEHSNIHPQEFFDDLLCCSGLIRHVLPKAPWNTIDHANMDFTGGKRGFLKNRDLICGAWSTIWLARLLMLSTENMETVRLNRTAASLALLWAARVAQIARAKVTVEGRERIPAGMGADIFLFNHTSFIDFALAPIALSLRPGATDGTETGSSIPIFLLAKDHFRNNPLYYRILGIGKAAEALDMIFVDRSGKGERSRAKTVAIEATEKLLSTGKGLAIYPQGSRAAPYIDRDKSRFDSAYYTVGPRERIKRDGAHLKKGAAHIATEATIALASSGSDVEVRLIPVAILGAGIACPRGTSRILSNVHMKLKFGETIEIHPSHIEGMVSPEGARPSTPEEDAYVDFVTKLHSRIDVTLKTAAQVHATLERRFFEDIRNMLDALQHEEIAVAIKPWRGDDFLFHAILDAIYACPPSRWRVLHGELIHLLLHFAPRAELLAFKARIADEIPL